MASLVENITVLLAETWRSPGEPRRGNTFRCHCGRPVFFRNSMCLACGAPLGYEPGLGRIHALLDGPQPGTWRLAGAADDSPLFRRCANFDSAAGCNWLLPAAHPSAHCVACRLNRTIPDLTDPENARCWRAIENAKRRLIAQLIAVGLPVASRIGEDPARGVMFDFLRSAPQGPKVITSHGHGLITLNIEEADDATRETIRQQMNEPYRTLLGHFRHEIGHYYWDRLIAGTSWHEKFRGLFGDERADYAAALQRSYQNGPPPAWRDHHISAYAAAHPWEDWAESFAHYLHLVDSLNTALGFGLSGDDIEAEIEPFTPDDLYDPADPDAARVLSLFNSWAELVTALNELARSMGQPDFYPFIMSRPVLRKLHFIQLVVKAERDAGKA